MFNLNKLHSLGTSLAECVCATNPNCENHAITYFGDTLTTIFFDREFKLVLSGLVERCSTTDSILFSNLECFFSHTDCFMFLSTLLHLPDSNTRYSVFPVRPLIANRTISRFPPNTLFKDIIEQLMVERWHWSLSYEHFYHSCAPKYCTYSRRMPSKTAMQVIIALISMLGGLVTSLRTITPYLVKLLAFVKMTLFQQRSRTPAPATSTGNT